MGNISEQVNRITENFEKAIKAMEEIHQQEIRFLELKIGQLEKENSDLKQKLNLASA